MADTQTQEPLRATAQGLLTDIERLIGQRFSQLKGELVDELGKATTAGVSVTGGLSMAALGTILGGIGVVHLIHEVTGLPLWLCYGAASATACGIGAGLIAEGVKKAGELELIPEGTGRAIREAATGNGR